MKNRFLICKLVNSDRLLFVVIDSYRDSLIRWCSSYEIAVDLADSLNNYGDAFEL